MQLGWYVWKWVMRLLFLKDLIVLLQKAQIIWKGKAHSNKCMETLMEYLNRKIRYFSI